MVGRRKEGAETLLNAVRREGPAKYLRDAEATLASLGVERDQLERVLEHWEDFEAEN